MAWPEQRATLSSRRRLLAALALTPLLGAVRQVQAADLPALIQRVRPSVLPVGTFNPLDSPRFGFRGTGFVVGDGRQLITNAHVLPEPGTTPTPQLAVLAMRDGGGREQRLARVLRVDRLHDLALLEFDGTPLPPVALAEDESVREGMDIALPGYPIGGVFGYSMVTHRGIIAAITAVALPSPTAQQLGERAIARLREGPFAVYQLDATAFPGNSGGPLFDLGTGQVVGVINMVLVRGTRESALSQPTGITYAIPAKFARELMKNP